MNRNERADRSHTSHSVENECVVALFGAADALRHHFGRVIEPSGLTLQQYNVLRILRGAGSEGLPTLEVAARMMERAPGISRMIDRLVRKGWVERVRCDEDRRRVYCVLTVEGRELLSGLDGPVDEADREAFAGLTEGERRTLRDVLTTVTEALKR